MADEKLEKIGEYGIEDIPDIDQSTMVFPSDLPLWRELVKAVQETHYRKNQHGESRCDAVKVVDMMFFKGGKMKFDEGARKKMGEEAFLRALRWFKGFMGSFDPKHEDKTAVCAWIADNLLECAAMVKEDEKLKK